MNSEIVLLSDVYKLDEITTPESRNQLVSTLNALDQRLLNEPELRRYFDTLKLAMGAFIQKVNTLESNIYDLRREQRAAELRMESMYLKAQLEIQSLKQEITEIRLSKGRITQIIKVAEALQGNAYAPYAIKSLVDGVVSSKEQKQKSTKLPTDYSNRLEFAKQNGFKWNQNNREPAKDFKKLRILEEWEDQFCRIERLSIDQVLDKRYVASLGSGAVAGGLMFLEKELGYVLEDRKSLSVFNCYQKAIKLYQQKQIDSQLPSPNNFDFLCLIRSLLPDLSFTEMDALAKRLENKNIKTPEQGISYFKKLLSKKMLPAGIKYDEEHITDTSRLYAIQSGYYDDQLIKKFSYFFRV